MDPPATVSCAVRYGRPRVESRSTRTSHGFLKIRSQMLGAASKRQAGHRSAAMAAGVEETKEPPCDDPWNPFARKATPVAAQPDHHHKWNPFVAKRVAMKLASPRHAAPAAAPAAAAPAEPTHAASLDLVEAALKPTAPAEAPAPAAAPPTHDALAGAFDAPAAPSRASSDGMQSARHDASAEGAFAAPAPVEATATAPAARSFRDRLIAGGAVDTLPRAAPESSDESGSECESRAGFGGADGVARTPVGKAPAAPEDPSPEALYLRRALPATSPAKKPPPAASLAKPKPLPPAATSPAKPKPPPPPFPKPQPKASVSDFAQRVFAAPHAPQLAVLQHARDVLREAAAALDIEVRRQKLGATPTPRPAGAALTRALRSAIDGVVVATDDADAPQVAAGLLRDVGDYLELEGRGPAAAPPKLKVREYFDPKKLDVVRGLDDVEARDRLKTLFAMYALPCGEQISVEGPGAHALGAPLSDAAAAALEAYATALEGARALAPRPSATLLPDVALDARLEALRGRVSMRAAQLTLCFALGPSLSSLAHALTRSARPRAALLAHAAALADTRRAARRARGALKAATRRGVAADDPRVRALERRAVMAERDTPAALFDLGAAHRALGEDRAASECYNAALAAASNIGGRAGAALQGRALHERAVTAEAASGYFAGAAAAYSQVLKLRREALGPTHEHVAETLWRRGRARWKSGDANGARLDFEEVLRIKEALGADEEDVAIVLVELGGAAQADARLPRAAQCFDRARRIREKTLGPTHVLSGECAKLGAKVHGKLGDHEKASLLYARAYHAFAKHGDRRKAARRAWLACRRESLKRALSGRKRAEALPTAATTLSETVSPPDATLSFAPPTPTGHASPRIASSSDGSMAAVNASWDCAEGLAARAHSPILVT